MDIDFTEIIQLLAHNFKLDITQFEDTFIMQILDKRIKVLNLQNLNEYYTFLKLNDDEIKVLAQRLNIHHTDFFRTGLIFAHLEQWILPRLLDSKTEKNELRIWSAGCSSGQEPYSVAMIIENINATRPVKKRYRIIATDISESILMKATHGEFYEKDVQNIKLKDLNEYFIKSGNRYKVNDRLKQNISFSQYDLLDKKSASPYQSIYGGFDLILCSNVLFYYKEKIQKNIIQKLVNALDINGYLISGDVEKQTVAHYSGMQSVVAPSPIFKKRGL